MKVLEITTMELVDGKSCSHPGCCSHISHPCEVCGRKGCHGKPKRDKDEKTIKKPKR